MRRDDFLKIMQCIQITDNSDLTEGDKMSKLRPFIESLRAKFLKNFQGVLNLATMKV